MDSTPLPPTPEQLAAAQTPEQLQLRNNKRKLVWGLVCLIGPTALLILTIILYVVVGSISSSQAATGDSLFPSQNPVQSVANTLMFLVGAITILTWLPGIIVGIILLATRRPLPRQN